MHLLESALLSGALRGNRGLTRERVKSVYWPMAVNHSQVIGEAALGFFYP
jgi:hypothetical protein